jgi:hypothetical protein
MAVTLTYDATLSRVRITATALAAADVATVERSTDQIRWTTVRGGAAVTVTAGALASTVDDYEFSPNVLNYYRVRGVETTAIAFRAAGATSTGNNASVTPALPAGIVVGDLLVIAASIRNSGTGTVNVPAGWTLIRAFGCLSLLGRRYVAGDAAPLVTFAGGVANADTLARMAAYRGADITAATGVDLLNGSAQDIAYPALTVPADDLLLIDLAWKQDDITTITARAGFTAVGAVGSTTTGDDAAQQSWYLIQTTAADLASGTHTVTGGASAISRAMTVALPHAAFLNEQSSSLTPTLTNPAGDCDSAVWLKSIARPFLNQVVQVINRNPVSYTRPARVGIFAIVGRTLPVAVSDVRGSRRFNLLLRTDTAVDASNMDYLLASGDTLLLQAPPDCSVPTLYVAIGDTTRESHPLRPLRVTWTLPCTEVAAPGADVIGAVGTWQTVIDSYTTWTTEIAANADWATLLTLVGSPSEVIVP